jgi:glutamine cyclotransferase
VIRPQADKIVKRPSGLFTQGLLFHDGALYESSGLYGQSAIFRWPHPKNAAELASPEATARLPEAIFAEGLAFSNGSLFLLTWKEGVVFKVDPGSLAFGSIIFAPGEGWGLASVGGLLLSSNGSDKLAFREPGAFAIKGEPLAVRDEKGPVASLNELEFDPASGLVLANIWPSSLVAAIGPKDGRVRYYLDLSALAEKERADSPSPQDSMANGLAIDEEGRLWVTGKYWRNLYRLSYQAP